MTIPKLLIIAFLIFSCANSMYRAGKFGSGWTETNEGTINTVACIFGSIISGIIALALYLEW